MKTGRFQVGPDKSVEGELRIAGRRSSLLLRDDDFFFLGRDPNQCLTGTLHDQTKVTLVDCLQSLAGSQTVEGVTSHYAKVFPHFIAQGGRYLDPRQATARAVSFTFEDAAAVFYDFDAFGAVVDAAPHIDVLTKAASELFKRPIRTGPHPRIAYFAGQELIVQADTTIGRITAQHRPSWPTGGPLGVRIDNQIWVRIEPELPVTFNEMTDRLMVLLRFITLAAGRRQTVPRFFIEVGESGSGDTLKVAWSHYPRRARDAGEGERTPHHFDLPLDPIRRPDEFVAVATSWIAMDTDRRAARVRMDSSFVLQNVYSVNRLVGAANAFDLMPASAAPKKVMLSEEVGAAVKLCKTAFRKLLESDERKSLFEAVARLGRASLKRKVRHRARIIQHAAGSQYFSDLEWVCNQAVEARNHFVHGSPIDLHLDRASGALGFLTDTLEFVFLASEFIESGWDIGRALKAGSSMSHPFGAYAVTYALNLTRLRAEAQTRGDPDDP